MDVWEDAAIWDELVDFGDEHPTVGPGRRLLGGAFDLTAEENQVYLFMVRRRTPRPEPPFEFPDFQRHPRRRRLTSQLTSVTRPPTRPSGNLQIIKKMRGLKAVTDTDLEMWDFAEEYEDMKHIHDPLDGDQKDNKRKKKRRG